MVTWADVPRVTPSSYPGSTWANTVADSTDLAGKYRKRARVCRTDGGAGSSTGPTAAKLNMTTTVLDNDGMAASGGLVVQTAGVWWVSSRIEWSSNGQGNMRLHVLYEATNSQWLDVDEKGGHTAYPTYTKVQTLEYFAAGERVELWCGQNSGASVSTGSGQYGACIEMVLISA